jgi:hypothetical protein
MIRNVAGPHGGGYLMLVLMPFAVTGSALLLYLVAMGVMTIWGAYEMGLGWLW